MAELSKDSLALYQNLLQGLEAELDSLEIEIDDVLIKAEQGIKLSRQVLKEIRDLVILKDFKSSKEEILFFKEIKPRIYSKIIYYVKLFNIESRRPRGTNKSQIKYLNDQIDRLQLFFSENLEFYHYYRRNATSLDEQYFIRGNTDIRLYLDTYHCLTDRKFSTSHDCTVATIIAYDMLIVDLKSEINKLENCNGIETIQALENPSKFFWTANKVDLIELIYALQSIGAINHGTAGIKEIASICEQIFNIDLGNFYHTYVEIRARKSNNTKFIDSLKKSLLKRFEESDR